MDDNNRKNENMPENGAEETNRGNEAFQVSSSPKKRRVLRKAAGIALLVCCCILISSVCGGISAYFVYSVLPIVDTVNGSLSENLGQSDSTEGNNTGVPMADISTQESTESKTGETSTQPEQTTEPTSAAPATEPPPLTTEPVTAEPMLIARQIYSENVNSVVGISAYSTERVSLLFGVYTTKEVVANGSGFLVTSDGYIVTNNHVVDGAHTLTVSTYDGTSYDAVLMGSDPDNDMALLKINGEGFGSVRLGESSDVSVGDSVLIVGNALGELSFSLTSGVVSYLNRSVSVDSHTMYMHQTDAAINVGNSGGPVFDMYGRVIGIASAKMSSESIEGLGFFIPIDNVKSKIIEFMGN